MIPSSSHFYSIFSGMQRPVVPEDAEVHREEAQEQVSEVLDKFSIEDQIESTRIQAQILALDSLRRAAENADNTNFTWEDDNAILNTQTFWESYLIIEPLKELGAKVGFRIRPGSIVSLFKIWILAYHYLFKLLNIVFDGALPANLQQRSASYKSGRKREQRRQVTVGRLPFVR